MPPADVLWQQLAGSVIGQNREASESMRDRKWLNKLLSSTAPPSHWLLLFSIKLYNVQIIQWQLNAPVLSLCGCFLGLTVYWIFLNVIWTTFLHGASITVSAKLSVLRGVIMGCCVQENRLNTHLSLQPLFTGLCSCRRRGISRVLVRERRYLTGLMRDGRRRANQSAQKTLHSPRNVWWTGRSHCRADCGAFRGVTSPAEVGKVLGPVEQRGPGGWVVGTASFFTYCNNRGITSLTLICWSIRALKQARDSPKSGSSRYMLTVVLITTTLLQP